MYSIWLKGYHKRLKPQQEWCCYADGGACSCLFSACIFLFYFHFSSCLNYFLCAAKKPLVKFPSLGLLEQRHHLDNCNIYFTGVNHGISHLIAASWSSTFQRQQKQKLPWQPSSRLWNCELFSKAQLDCLFGSSIAFVSYLCLLINPFCLNRNHGILPSAARSPSNLAQQSSALSLASPWPGGPSCCQRPVNFLLQAGTCSQLLPMIYRLPRDLLKSRAIEV